MANKTVDELRKKTDSAWGHLTRQLAGMEPHLERADAPGEWTTRQVLTHLLCERDWDAVKVLKSFAEGDLPLLDIEPGLVDLTPERRTMSLKQLVDALDAQRRSAFDYLAGVPEADLTRRKARIPLFKQFMGTDEISLPVYVGAMFDFHWNDHAGQLAKIRKAAGLPEAQ
ncbi:MAG TPA: DinB family protein [Methylomirabilota bacterium]|jgi:hypothetical protein|nr:DinB family protein [Methylomirabilota bacterium]